MNRAWNAVVVCTALLSFTSSAATPQPTLRRVKHKVSCASCAIELTPVATIGGRSDSVSIARTSYLDRDSQGRFFAFSDDSRVLVYNASGQLLKTLGRRGDGPGEFNAQVPFGITDVVVGRGDSLFVFHPPKVTVFSPALAYVRTLASVQAAGIKSINPVGDGAWLVAGSNRAPEHVGRPVFVLNPDGSIRKSLGPEQTVAPGRSRRSIPPLKVSPDRRSVWINGEYNRYALTQWSIDGRLLASLEIEDTPFLPEPTIVTHRAPSGRTFQIETGGEVVITGVDTLGQVWAYGKAPGAKLGDGILEILDPRTGEVLVSQKMRSPVSLLRSGDLAFTGVSDSDGFITVTVSKYRVIRR